MGLKKQEGFYLSTFKMKDLGQMDIILGIKVKMDSGGFYIKPLTLYWKYNK